MTTTNSTTTQQTIKFGAERLTIEDVCAIANGAHAEMNNDTAFNEKIDRGVAFLERLLKDEGVIYGVTTGYGDSCTVAIPPKLVDELPLHLTRFHGCGLGEVLQQPQARAVLATRLCSLSQGVSGVSHELLNQLVTLINHDIVPRIPEEGSVGASGDLTPLSYVAATLIGERDVIYKGEIRPTAEVFAELGISPIQLRPKEGLALMNGTSVMTALACLAYKRAEYLAQMATKITAMVSVAMQGNDFHFDEALFAVKPHPGQQQIASWLRSDLQAERPPRNSDRLQDRYSLRCAPHVIGVLQDSLPWLRQMIENELNSANDNPIIDGDNERVLHGGHFYGGHIAMAMDTLKTAVANIADLLDRQMAQLMDYKFNNGLPFNLTGAVGERKPINHGFKAVQIGISAWTAEALKHTMPASVFSRSTECHNQDKVSMGTIASRDCLRVLQLTEQVTAASLLAATQAIELRKRDDELNASHLSPALTKMNQSVLEHFEPVIEDRPLEHDLRLFIDMIQQQHWALYY
ncbi:histidine ammonia-lyase [Photobacterium sp. GB-27]|uniref:HAL/PAL/TAL family ammonia-lyase n=1 Tax=unclassified Photobacterium TaxID=2628852 RepID=UPI000D169CF1|nr:MULTISPECIES: aromatic amino acid ammonia-lyase [unclassified Photobacterium]PSV26375.1 histidine ammonia-lyase [Photobacterium sp. GB-56]PSV31510.1 histidine ammonia-lyase [Photobacterium sp. GB-72]PSV33822.1 histidine ammonia-lyase [Photobacterium sp. GB-27]PSV36797.1 histidine ammonia-lyase [Photobacterium sp. GB-210]PSV46048.1 histidine ammonia-lyase [Photobacterium sp. GB-36]